MISFKGFSYPKEVIFQSVRWYVSYNLSYRNLEEMQTERGVFVDHSSTNRWVLLFAPQLEQVFHCRKRRPDPHIRLDETYLLIKGLWYYLYLAVDQTGDTVEFLLTKHRDKKPAKRFLLKLIRRNGEPNPINIDKSRANKAAIREVNDNNNTLIKITQSKLLNNIIASVHRFVRRKMRQAMGFEGFHTAVRTIAGIELWRMLKKAQKKWEGLSYPVEGVLGLFPR